MVEQVCTGQEDCLTGPLAAGSYSCLPAVTMEGEWGQADGTLVDLPVSSLQHKADMNLSWALTVLSHSTVTQTLVRTISHDMDPLKTGTTLTNV